MECKQLLNSLIFCTTIVIAFLGMQSSQERPNPSIVAQDGSGTFQTIADAIKATTNYSIQKQYIKIKAGVYHENLIIGREKTNIVLISEGTTVISGNRSNATGFSLTDTATVGILGDGFMAQGITFMNTAGPMGYQAIAVYARARFLTFYQCKFIGYQDTLYAQKGIMFFRDCKITGTIDFIFGDSTVVFQNCTIRVRKPLPDQYITITAQGRVDARKTGFVFHNCTVQTDELQQRNSHIRCYLGRPWREFSRVVFIQSYMDQIEANGWIKWKGKPLGYPYFGDYDNKGPLANTTGRVNWTTIITKRSEASKFTVRNFLNGSTWIPSTVPSYLDLL